MKYHIGLSKRGKTLVMVIQDFDDVSKEMDLAVNGDHRLPPRRAVQDSERH